MMSADEERDIYIFRFAEEKKIIFCRGVEVPVRQTENQMTDDFRKIPVRQTENEGMTGRKTCRQPRLRCES